MNIVEKYMGDYSYNLDIMEKEEYNFLSRVVCLKNVLSVKTYKLVVMVECYDLLGNDNLNNVKDFLTAQLESYQHENCIEMHDIIKFCINRLNEFINIKLSDDKILI